MTDVFLAWGPAGVAAVTTYVLARVVQRLVSLRNGHNPTLAGAQADVAERLIASTERLIASTDRLDGTLVRLDRSVEEMARDVRDTKHDVKNLLGAVRLIQQAGGS